MKIDNHANYSYSTRLLLLKYVSYSYRRAKIQAFKKKVLYRVGGTC
jgi:hypothetical protein